MQMQEQSTSIFASRNFQPQIECAASFQVCDKCACMQNATNYDLLLDIYAPSCFALKILYLQTILYQRWACSNACLLMGIACAGPNAASLFRATMTAAQSSHHAMWRPSRVAGQLHTWHFSPSSIGTMVMLSASWYDKSCGWCNMNVLVVPGSSTGPWESSTGPSCMPMFWGAAMSMLWGALKELEGAAGVKGADVNKKSTTSNESSSGTSPLLSLGLRDHYCWCCS